MSRKPLSLGTVEGQGHSRLNGIVLKHETADQIELIDELTRIHQNSTMTRTEKGFEIRKALRDAGHKNSKLGTN